MTLLSYDEMSITVCLYNILYNFFMINYGIATSMCHFVGNYLGAGKPDIAKQAMKIGLALTTIVTVFNVTFINVFKHWLIGMYTTDPGLQSGVSRLFPFLSVFMPPDYA